jgi:hypothetical protein
MPLGRRFKSGFGEASERLYATSIRTCDHERRVSSVLHMLLENEGLSAWDS